jgi:hypothetical protein
MTNLDAGRAGTARAGERQRRGGMLFAGETEARPGVLTSEFLLTVLAASVVVIASYASDTVPQRWGWVLFTAIVTAYILSRGIAKAGSKEGPFVGKVGDGTER